MKDTPAEISSEQAVNDRLDSWKDIAAYLQREVRTVQLWEKNEGLPVHRHTHSKRGTVYAYKAEIDAWWKSRQTGLSPQNFTPKLRSPWQRIAAVAVSVFIVCGAAWLVVARKPQTGPRNEPEILPLTSDPGSEMGASFSPDGSEVAFAWKREGRPDFDIYVKVVGSHEVRQLTNTPDWDVSPAWSPDGRRIVFHRRAPGPDAECGIYSVSPLGGPATLVLVLSGASAKTPGCELQCGCWAYNPKLSSAQFSWSPDGKWLAHAGISLVSTVTGEQRILSFPPGKQIDAYPAFSPDGKQLAFVRTRTYSSYDLYVIPAEGGEPRRLATQGQLIFGLDWTDDGREIVYSSGVSSFSDATLWRVPVDGGPARRLEAVRERGWLPAISPDGRRLAFTRRSGDTNIWQVAEGGGDQSTATKLIASTLTDAAPAFSPDGARIAFSSDRSGTMQVWVCDRDGSNPRQVTFFPAPGAALATWSPDSKQLAFSSSLGGRTDIYIINASGGTPRQLTPTDGSNDAAPSWSHDGKWIYFASDRTGRLEIWKIPAVGGPPFQVTKNGGNRPVASLDGKYVFHDKGPASRREFHAWRTQVTGGEERPVCETVKSRWAVVSTGLYFYESAQLAETTSDWRLKFFEFSTNQSRVVAKLPGIPVIGQRPAVSPDGRTILYTQLDLNDTDILLVDDFK
jgi:Tol biopolymer transport system component